MVMDIVATTMYVETVERIFALYSAAKRSSKRGSSKRGFREARD